MPTKVPAQLPEYHFQEAPVPKDPPVTLRFVGEPAQTGFELADADAAAVESD